MVEMRGFARLRAGPVAALTRPRRIIHHRSLRIPPLKQKKTRHKPGFSFGGDEGIRTPGLLHAKQALSQLSHTPICIRQRMIA